MGRLEFSVPFIPKRQAMNSNLWSPPFDFTRNLISLPIQYQHWPQQVNQLKRRRHKSRVKGNCSKSVLLKRWQLLEVIKRCRKPSSTTPLIRENRLNPFESVPLTIQPFEMRKGMTVKYGTRCSIFCKILPSHLFLMSRKFTTQGCQWIKSIFADEIVEQGWGHLYYLN